MTDKLSWQEKVKATEAFHKAHLRDDASWTMTKTAKELNRSVGRVSEDIMLARYMRTHPRVEMFKTAIDAIDYCKKIKRDQRINL